MLANIAAVILRHATSAWSLCSRAHASSQHRFMLIFFLLVCGCFLFFFPEVLDKLTNACDGLCTSRQPTLALVPVSTLVFFTLDGRVPLPLSHQFSLRETPGALF